VLGNGVTPSAADVAVYADLHSSVPGLGKAKTAMMLRNRFLGKLPKPGLVKKYVSQSHSVSKMDNLSGLPDELLVRILSSNIHCLYLWIFSTRICHYIELLSLKASFFMGVKGENIKPEDIKMWVEIAVYRYLRKLDVSYSSVKRKHGSQQLVYLQNACDLENLNQYMPFH
ncbi:LOW QUALITY PROTEIN: hypothetical protein HID58_037945, partial [Brassica napus]